MALAKNWAVYTEDGLFLLVLHDHRKEEKTVVFPSAQKIENFLQPEFTALHLTNR